MKVKLSYWGRAGSVGLDGASLTVSAVEGDTFEVLLIPHTLKVTTWGERRADDKVNIEVDQTARYATRLMEAGRRLMEIRDAVPKDAACATTPRQTSISEAGGTVAGRVTVKARGENRGAP